MVVFAPEGFDFPVADFDICAALQGNWVLKVTAVSIFVRLDQELPVPFD